MSSAVEMVMMTKCIIDWVSGRGSWPSLISIPPKFRWVTSQKVETCLKISWVSWEDDGSKIVVDGSLE